MKTKLCVSLFVDNISDTIQRANSAIKKGADVVEFRLDTIEKNYFTLDNFIHKLKQNKLLSKSIFTVRSKKEFGKWKYSEQERKSFLLEIAKYQPTFLDIEFANGVQFIKQVKFISPQTTFILSFHTKQISPSQLFSLYNKMKSYNCDVIKIAVEMNTVEQTLPLFSLLENAKSEKQKLIAVGIGKKGEATRILAQKYNAFLTFASADNSSQTASGQISLLTLLKTYNFKSINSRTKVFALLGNPVSHSKGIYVHNAAFRKTKTNAVYINCEMENINQFRKLSYNGFSITAPHKQSVIKFLDNISPTVKQIGAVNTVVKRNDKLLGKNTDGVGFRESIPKNVNLENKNIAVLGCGGAAKSIIAILKRENANITIFNRTITKAKQLANHFSCNYDSLDNFPKTYFDVLINTIPFSVSKYFSKQFSLANKNWKGKIVCDIIYNPTETPFLQTAKKNGATIVQGWKMFLYQAIMQFELFTNKKAPIDVMKNVLLKSLQ